MKESLLRIMMLTSLTMVQTISLLARLIDTLAPRSCTICGRRLTVTEEVMCACCNHCLPRTVMLNRVMTTDLYDSSGVGFHRKGYSLFLL